MACKTCWGLGVRHIQLFLIMGGFAVVLIFRICPMMAIRLAKHEQQASSSYHEDPFKNTVTNWAETDLLPIEFSFYYVYPIATSIGGIVALRVNPKYALLSTTLFLSLMSFAVPSILRSRTEVVGYTALCTMRVVIGLIQGFNESVSYQILGRWAPVMDYCKASALLPTGTLMGYLMIHGAMYFIGKNVMGWATVFYTSGNMGILWCVAWATFGSNDFRSCFYISAEERLFMVHNTVDLDSYGLTSGRGEKRPYRWRMLLTGKTSKNVYVLMIASLMIDWASSDLLMPPFMEDYFGAGIENSGLSYDPNSFFNSRGFFFILGVVVILWCSIIAFLADYAVNKKKVPEAHQRKTCNSIGLWGQSITFVLSGFSASDSSKVAAARLGTVVFFFAIFSYVGIGVSYIEMAPNYSGLTYGIVKTVSNCPRIIICLYRSLTLTEDTTLAMTRVEYRKHCFSGALVYFFANFFYVSLYSCKVQEWNKANIIWTKSISVAYN